MRRTGIVLSATALLFLLMDSVMKLLALQPVVESFVQLGYPGTPEFARGMGVLLLVCTLLYAWPRTSRVGAVLLTGYLGGALASHLRIGSPLFTHTLFSVYVALFVWGGLVLRDPLARAFWLGRRTIEP